MAGYLIHSAKGTTWTKKDHKYIDKVGDQYIYDKDEFDKEIGRNINITGESLSGPSKHKSNEYDSLYDDIDDDTLKMLYPSQYSKRQVKKLNENREKINNEKLDKLDKTGANGMPSNIAKGISSSTRERNIWNKYTSDYSKLENDEKKGGKPSEVYRIVKKNLTDKRDKDLEGNEAVYKTGNGTYQIGRGGTTSGTMPEQYRNISTEARGAGHPIAKSQQDLIEKSENKRNAVRNSVESKSRSGGNGIPSNIRPNDSNAKNGQVSMETKHYSGKDMNQLGQTKSEERQTVDRSKLGTQSEMNERKMLSEYQNRVKQMDKEYQEKYDAETEQYKPYKEMIQKTIESILSEYEKNKKKIDEAGQKFEKIQPIIDSMFDILEKFKTK